MGLLVATKYRGIRGAPEDNPGSAGNVILVIDEVHTLIGAGPLKAQLMRLISSSQHWLGELQCIGATGWAASTLSGMPPSSAGSNQSWWVNPRWRRQ